MPEKLRLAELLGGLSMVADLGFGLPPETAVRTSLVGAALARRMNLADGDVRDSFYTGLLMHLRLCRRGARGQCRGRRRHRPEPRGRPHQPARPAGRG